MWEIWSPSFELEHQKGVHWDPWSVVKAFGFKQFRLSMTRVDGLYRCVWKVPELGPPGCVLVYTVCCAPRLSS